MLSRYTKLLDMLLSELITCWQRPIPEKLSLESAFLITQHHCSNLKHEYAQHKFTCDSEEIYFFKKVHPQFAGRMMYYSTVYESVTSSPACPEAAKIFWSKELDRYDRFRERYERVVQYIDQHLSDEDERYFLRKTGDRIVYVHEKAHFMCADETTIWSTTAAMCFAEKSYQQYVLSRLSTLDHSAVYKPVLQRG